MSNKKIKDSAREKEEKEARDDRNSNQWPTEGSPNAETLRARQKKFDKGDTLHIEIAISNAEQSRKCERIGVKCLDMVYNEKSLPVFFCDCNLVRNKTFSCSFLCWSHQKRIG